MMIRLKQKARNLLAAQAPDLLVTLLRQSRKRDMAEALSVPTETFLREQFREKTGLELDIQAPTGLSEKLNALKLRPVDPLQTLCADKIRVREHVAARLGEQVLVPKIMATYRLNDITPRNIRADKFVIKTNHDFAGVIICRDRSRFDWSGARAKLADHLAFNHWLRHREPPYREIRPGVLVETFLEPDSPAGLREYKIFCFNGQPHFIMVIEEGAGRRFKTVYDTDWRRLPVHRRAAPSSPSSIERPQRLGELLDAAKALAEPFDFCRVDLYENFGRVLFGEITFYPEGGMDVFEPPEWERRIGDLLHIDRAGHRTQTGLTTSEWETARCAS